MIASGTVLSLSRWPVKSMAGEAAQALRLDERGVGGDRAHVLLDEHKGAPRQLTIRQVPRMVLWSAAYAGVPGEALDPHAPPLPVLTAPDGASYGWDDPRLPEALAADLGRPVALERDLRLRQDLERSVLITVHATHQAIEEALSLPLDLRRWRTNVHLALDAEPFAEECWGGRRLRIGDADLELLHPCERCVIPTRDPDTATKQAELLRWLTRERGGLFGMNARPLGPATIRVGDPVTVHAA